MKDWVEALSPITVPAQSQISFVKLLEESQLTAIPSGISSMIASGIYSTILSTNFEIIERHIGQVLPDDIELGYEAKINPDNHLDFVFGNPNDTEYMIELQWSYPVLTVQLKGSPFLYKYEIVESDKKEFKPKTIIQYSPQLLPEQNKVKEAGKHGYLIKISRKVLGEKGELLREEIISEDFYVPVEKVEVHGLKAGTTSDDATTDTIQDDTEPATDTTNADSSTEVDQETTDTNESTKESQGQGQKDSLDNDFWGKPNESEK
nr:VanW family protein [Mesobacillus maritimus]